MDVYERVAAALEERNMSKAELGRKLGITGQAVTLKLQGKRPITLDEFAVIASALRVSVGTLLGETAVIVERDDELALLEAYRKASGSQRDMLRNLMGELVPRAEPDREPDK